jgi:HAD superfamily hydrolase (TIGR01548 family)
MDGVLVDESNSYRIAIKKTAQFFTKTKITIKDVNKIKSKIGFNNDWDATEAIILNKGKKVPKQKIIDKFQEYYLGENWNGLILNEPWLINNKLLKQLSSKYKLGIVTGRPSKEAKFVLKKNGAEKYFKLLIAMEDVKKSKPDPEGINKALKFFKSQKATYFGDTINDKIAAKKANINFEIIKNNINNALGKYLEEIK